MSFKRKLLKRLPQAAALLCSAALTAGLLAGCGQGRQIVLTTGLKKNEVFRLAEKSCILPEVMVYLTNMQNQYEAVYGKEIWNAGTGEGSLEQEVKEVVLAQLAQVKALALLAEEKEIVLEEKEQDRAAAAAKEYTASLNETELALMGADEALIGQMYTEYALAGKVHQAIVEDVNPEISDDEARTITVLAIRLSESSKAREVYGLVTEEGADFEALAELYSEDVAISYSFSKGEKPEVIEKAAFDLGKDEISSILETEEGFYILKCTSTFDEAQTRVNKEKILQKRRDEAFASEYNAFADSLVRQLNEELWQTVTLIQDDNVTTGSFFDVFDKYFEVEA